MATITYAHFPKPSTESTNPSQDNVERLYPDEYVDEKHYRNIFCPECKEPLTRIPRRKSKTVNGKTAYFKHYKSDVECSWHKRKPNGINFLNKHETQQAIKDENLLILSKWSSVSESENKETSDKNDISENSHSDELISNALGGYEGAEIPSANRITSVKTIVENIETYMEKAIVFPGSKRAIRIKSLLKSLDADDLQIDDSNSYLYVGRIETFVRGKIWHFLNLAKKKRAFRVQPEISKSRGFNQQGCAGRMVIAYGMLPAYNSQVYLEIRHLGQVAFVPKENEELVLELMASNKK
ncbi:hypothetical protein [Ostreibacterium oceani]|uniref:Uncharacterized protein n=1 Tax=Ostreibacterium oceani TaxID=2654998 RepID=A0A6N7EW06_9GAMM|nr:hypothetical protein [Ostreibacterium oceani]MPV85740.1 hypothetical protein [Ostreibacterium oceani]